MRFLKIATTMFPVERIEWANANAHINGVNGVEVKLQNIPETFTYVNTTENPSASQAWDAINAVAPELLTGQKNLTPPVTRLIGVTVNGQPVGYTSLVLDGEPICIHVVDQMIMVDDIEWVAFAANINGTTGVEVRVITDQLGLTRQFLGRDNANEAYDVLSALAVDVPLSATN